MVINKQGWYLKKVILNVSIIFTGSIFLSKRCEVLLQDLVTGALRP